MSQRHKSPRFHPPRSASRLLFTGAALLTALGAFAYGQKISRQALDASAFKRGTQTPNPLSPLLTKMSYLPTPNLRTALETVVAGMSAEVDETGVVRRLRGSVTVRGAKSSGEAADRFLLEHHAVLGLSTNLNELKLSRTDTSLTRIHAIYDQVYSGLPVFGGQLGVHTDKNGAVELVNADLVPIPHPQELRTNLPSEAAVSMAVKAVGTGAVPTQAPTTELGVFVQKGSPLGAWRVRFDTRKPAAAWEIYVDANSGEVLQARNIARYAEGTGKVYFPDPVTTSGDATLVDNNNADTALLTAQRVTKPMLGLDGTGYLTGTYAKTVVASGVPRAFSSSFNYDYTRSQSQFDETMCYYHIDTIARYLQSLGFTSVENRQVTINVNGILDDNAFYSPATKQITMGSGGVNDSQDAEVIWHENGHAIQDNQVPGWGASEQAGAMGEGFGDYWAASQFAGIGPQSPAWDVFVGKWDATFYDNHVPPRLRDVISTKHYPENSDGEVHDDGEMWSASLWQVRGIVGRARADKLVLEAHYSVSTTGTFADGSNAILAANQSLYNGADGAAVRRVFVDRGFIAVGNTPTNLAATAVSATRIDLAWTDTNTGETGYKIERKSGAEAFTQIALTSANAVSYSDTTALPSTSYTYRIRAAFPDGDSFYSASASAATPILTYSVSGKVSGYAGLGGITVGVSGNAGQTGSTSASPALAIPDNNPTGVASSLTVAGTGTITGVHVSVDITHTYIGDLEVSLIGPDNTVVLLHNRTGGSADNIATTYPDATAPAGSLGAFTGKAIAGTWKLKVRDLAALDTGTLNQWTLTLDYNGPLSRTVTTAADGTYTFLALTPATYTVAPTTAGLTFSPAPRTVTLASNTTGVDFSAAAGLSGTIGLEGPSNLAKPLQFDFRPSGGGAAVSRTLTPTSAGAYAFSDIPAGAYTLAVKGSKWLRKTVAVDLSRTRATPVNLSLLAGDVNNNNVVDVDDLTLLLNVYNTTNGDGFYNAGADFNDSGAVDVDDLTLLLNNYNKAGSN